MTRLALLSDDMWARIEPLLPPTKGPMGPPFRPHRPVVEAVLYRLRTGVAWRDLPKEFGAWQTVHRRHQSWSRDGVWDHILATLQADADADGEVDWRVSVDSTIARVHQHGATAARSSVSPFSHTRAAPNDTNQLVEPDDHGIGRSRGGLTTKTHALVDGKGRPLVVLVSPGQAGDSPALPKLLAELRVACKGPGRPRTTPELLRGDMAYSSRGHRAMLRARGIKTVIPEPADQAGHRRRRGSRGGRPVSHDSEDYKNRNVVERFFNRMKNWRGLATRYDKHAVVYRGGVVLAAILDWLKRP